MGSAYGGGRLSADCATTAANRDSEAAVVTAVGMTFTVGVATDEGDADNMGFNIVWNQVQVKHFSIQFIDSGRSFHLPNVLYAKCPIVHLSNVLEPNYQNLYDSDTEI